MSPMLHADDTVAAGAGLVDPAVAALIAREGPERVLDLVALGVPFDRTPDGALAQSLEAAHSRPRVVRVSGDLAGKAIMDALIAALRAKRDWGFAGDYVEAMWRMLQLPAADDFVIATGECYTVKQFLEVAFGHVDLDWTKHVEIDPRYFRPTEVDELRGDMTKARTVLDWEPKVKFDGLVKMMVDADLAEAQRLGDRSRRRS